jgi:hypothetical protein
MKNITERFNNQEETYRVQFIGTSDTEGLPIDATIIIDKENRKYFEKFLIKEKDNIFSHACSMNNENIEY